MPTPNLIIAGAQKAGTTSLHAQLGAHPILALSEPKEPHVLAYVEADDAARAAYGEVFPTDGTDRVRVETGTEYLILKGIPERIRAVCGDVKIAFLLRNPIDRAWSQYRWLTSLGIERRTFRTAFLADLDEVPDVGTEVRGHMRYYFTHGCYGRHISRYLKVFDPEDLLILSTDEFSTTPEKTLQSVMVHAGVEPVAPAPTGREHVTQSLRFPRLTHVLHGHEVVHHARTDPGARLLHRARRIISSTRGVHGISRRLANRLERLTRVEPSLDPADRRWLASYYAGDVEALRASTGVTFSEWDEDFPRGA